MKYLNQLQYKHIPYRTRVSMDVEEAKKNTTLSSSGCGLCSVCMMIELLTDKTLELEDAIQISYDCVANHSAGIDMEIYGPVVAEKFDLAYSNTSDLDEAIRHLQNGGKIVIHVRIPEEGKLGLFTKSGHYLTLISTDGKDFCILDPSYTPTKFHIPEREGKVNENSAPYLYCDVNTVHAEGRKDGPIYHLFSRKKI